MSFVKFSSNYIENNKTQIDNIFFNDYLPYAPSEFVKAYVYAVYLSGLGETADNSLEGMCRALQMEELELLTALKYWEKEGLLNLYDEPVKVVLLPLKDAIKVDHKWNKSKYEEFNLILQDLKSGEMISTNEYNAYYQAMDKLHLDIPSMLMIVKFCVGFKESTNVSYKYILQVAENWARDGAITQEKIQQKIDEFNSGCNDTVDVLRKLGSKKKPSFEEGELYEKWTRDFGFSKDVVLYVASQIKQNKNFFKLDAVLTKYYEQKLLSQKEIADFEERKNDLLSLAKQIDKKIGVYYEDLDNVIEKYILPWQNLGFDDETLQTIADYCFKKSVRTLEGMNGIVFKFHKNGVVSKQALAQYVETSIQSDKQIQKILELCGIVRNVNSWDRDFWRTWTYTWNTPVELVEYGATLACGKSQPMQYLNKLISTWKEEGVNTIEKAKEKSFATTNLNSNKKCIQTREYSKEELEAVFSNLDDLI